MSQQSEELDLQDEYRNILIHIDNLRENIKDARRALRSSQTKLDKKVYHSVIRHNRAQLRDARNSLKLLKTRTKRTWWLWLIALLLCVVLMVVFPGASLALVFAPLWITALIGIIVILFLVKK
jgi:Flp pilus assembly protein TadB